MARTRELQYFRDGLRELIRAQSTVSEQLDQTSVFPTMRNRALYGLAFITEVVEFIDELGWKPWKHDRAQLDRAKALEELADVIAYFGLLLTWMTRLGFSVDEIVDAYLRKRAANLQRTKSV